MTAPIDHAARRAAVEAALADGLRTRREIADRLGLRYKALTSWLHNAPELSAQIERSRRGGSPTDHAARRRAVEAAMQRGAATVPEVAKALGRGETTTRAWIKDNAPDLYRRLTMPRARRHGGVLKPSLVERTPWLRSRPWDGQAGIYTIDGQLHACCEACHRAFPRGKVPAAKELLRLHARMHRDGEWAAAA